MFARQKTNTKATKTKTTKTTKKTNQAKEEEKEESGAEPRRKETHDDGDESDFDSSSDDEIDMLARAGEIGVVLVDPPRAGRSHRGSTLATALK